MDEEIMFIQNEDGKLEKYDDTYDVVVHCKSEEERQKVVGTLKNKISEWIPCSEKLPEVNIPVLTQWGVYCSGENRIEILRLNEFGRWHGDSGEPNGKVIAWMPLPEPYREEQ